MTDAPKKMAETPTERAIDRLVREWTANPDKADLLSRAFVAEIVALRSSLQEAREERDYWKQEHAALLRIRQREHEDRFGAPEQEPTHG